VSEPTQKAEISRQRAAGLRGHIAGVTALVALFVVVAAWFWATRQPAQVDAGIGLPHGVIVAGTGAFVAALIAEIRAMSFWEILEAAWDLLLGMLSVIGSILMGIWNGILGLFGWD
jgi:uncharacterized membrane protein